jgi:hypothetical protein
VRAEPPPQWRDDDETVERPLRRSIPLQRCPYLEQILRERTGLGLLTRYKADCHVDRRTHTFTGRHPAPPCITEPATCSLYRDQWATETRAIDRYRD